MVVKRVTGSIFYMFPFNIFLIIYYTNVFPIMIDPTEWFELYNCTLIRHGGHDVNSLYFITFFCIDQIIMTGWCKSEWSEFDYWSKAKTRLILYFSKVNNWITEYTNNKEIPNKSTTEKFYNNDDRNLAFNFCQYNRLDCIYIGFCHHVSRTR